MTDENPPRAASDLAGGHTVRRYDEELAKLRAIILEMGEHVVGQARSAVMALVDRDDSQAYRVLDREPQIDYLSLDADEEVFRVIARRQPTAVDLRIVLALSKIASDAERAGDKAKIVAEQALELKKLSGDSDYLRDDLRAALGRLEDAACSMFERSIRAVVNFDVALSLAIFEDEPRLSDASTEVRHLLGEDDQKGLSQRQVVCLLTCAHGLVRIGNHASNIAEQVIYVALGQDVRYRNREILIETLHHQGY
ncbi:phosphate uptake regulator, PhoU [Thiorhodococcus drewsii AZ1]|uniref:Phosphate uptake regulator, PhoU n=1 Tax=Thiorhodococcus drewsii AZ1 TaxID=765913 RepID=G2E3E8_9GAMM|nr:phosphate signaling complex protein PhoU [Thiorhodococcus drewsii]EGV30337.1 phosphate uptake regulator, PhoU [Thiorhodococcus drewsii AZ1]